MDSSDRFKPLGAMIALQFGYAVMNIMTRASLTSGMSPYVFVTYRQAIATMVISPVAFILERKKRPALRFPIVCQIFIMSLIGITVNQILYFKGLYLASSTLATAMSNLIPALTFVIAAVIGLERINIRCVRGQAKVLGTFMCVGGAMIMVLYKGATIGNLWTANIHIHMAVGRYDLFMDNFIVDDWKMGSFYLFGGCLCWCVWFIQQASILKKYPAQVSLTALMCFFATAQSAVVTLIVEPHPNVWTFEWNFELLCIIYSGVVCSGIAFCVQTWCIYKRGPVFVAMFNPLLTIIVAIMASIILQEKNHVGSAAGGILIVGGVYGVLWGKAKDTKLSADEPTPVNPTKSLPIEFPKSIKSAEFNIDITEPLLMATKDSNIQIDT